MRRVPLAPRILDRLILHADATGSGALAWVAILGNLREYARAQVAPALRRWALPRKQHIDTWELLAAVCALWQIEASLVRQVAESFSLRRLRRHIEA